MYIWPVQDEGSTLETQSRAITRRKKGEIAPLEKDQAQVIEEVEIAFDDDLRAAIIQSLVRNKEWIKQQANTERASSEALELARLEAVERARVEGKQKARSQMAAKKREQKAAIQQRFIDVELAQLLDSCDYLGYETMKKTVNEFANRVGVNLSWEELEDGEFRCTPSIV
ncbi:hypothetical protein [uncultured Nostoc sp.]|uniref:hypothetical protein n=1 Tax=uncultured Nostoc sp. TaxID=340711 RepID=UPI0035CC41D9